MTERTSANSGRGVLTATVVNPNVGQAILGSASGNGRLSAAVYPKIPVAANLTGNGTLTDFVPPVINRLVTFTVTGSYFAVADPSISGTLNTPTFQPINALVTFTPRLEKGQMIRVENYLIAAAYNAEQTIFLLGTPTAGTWTIAFAGDTTWALPWNATPAAVQAALQALPAIGSGNVRVVADGAAPFAYDVEFINGLGLQRLPVLEGNADNLENARGSGFCEITVAPTALGSQEIIADAAIAISPITARIYSGILSTINVSDTPGVQLVANTPELGLDTLVYDIEFSKVTFNGAEQPPIAPFAFVAPTYGESICLTSPSMSFLDYEPPSDVTFVPASGGMDSNTWRTRSRRSQLRTVA